MSCVVGGNFCAGYDLSALASASNEDLKYLIESNTAPMVSTLTFILRTLTETLGTVAPTLNLTYMCTSSAQFLNY